MKVVTCLALLTTIAMLGTATAQTKPQTKTRSFTVKQGATVAIGTYYQINKRNCQAGPLPRIVQTSSPTIGKLIIEETKVEPSQKQCKG
jgi:predicted secreted Zn-dependent protease